jgi:hypothetical protein
MKRVLATSVATVLSAVLFAAAPAPVIAGGVSFEFGGGDYDVDPFDYGGGYDYDDDDDDDSGITIQIEPPDVDVDEDDDDGDDDEDDLHVAWCHNHYQTYDESTNLYYYAIGKQRECNSPYD